MTSDTAVLIPARLGATRLPNKPLADIGGVAMIVRVLQAAQASGLEYVGVVTDSDEIAALVRSYGGIAFMSDPALPSGTDRVAAAFLNEDALAEFDYVINLQGDLPFFEPQDLARVSAILHESTCDIATLAAVEPVGDVFNSPHAVKVIGTSEPVGLDLYGAETPPALGTRLKAHYFTRSAAPYGARWFYHHVGVYGFRRDSLQRFVALPPSPLETSERLEQLRALEHGMSIVVEVVQQAPMSVDTSDDLERARTIAAQLSV